MNKYKLYWICQVVGWQFYAVVNIFAYFAFNEQFDEKQILSEIFFRAVLNIAITHYFRLLLIKKGWLKFVWQQLFPIIAVLILIMALINYTAIYTLAALWESDSNLDTPREIFIGISEPLVLYTVWSIIYFTFHYFERYNKSLQYEVAINEFELNNLKTQLNPHFIFNALNSIRALVDEDPKKSKLAITQLSNILRNSLILDKKKLISFEDEIKTVKDYLELESVRYEERLIVKYDIASESIDFNVPPMMVQTLVENGIKHGVSKLTNGGTIAITTEVNNHTLKIEIRNSGQYKNKKNDDQMGFGLQNTIKRLDLIYGEEASFLIQNENNNTVLTQLVIPETI